jgi:hypothetical protein
LAALIHVFRREAPSAQARAEASMKICLEQRIPFWLEWGRVVHGWALAAQGQGEEGIGEVCRGLEAFRALGSKSELSCLLPYPNLSLRRGIGLTGLNGQQHR